MKIKSILAFALVIAACGKTEKASDEQTQTTTKETNEALKVVLTGYFDVKDALVNDDAAKAKEAAAALIASTGDYANALNESLNKIASTDDIEAQRVAFETLSMNLYEAAKQGGAGMTIYKQYCPMAFDDKGAFWLSDEKQVLNPYFGASMLRCGSVKEEIN
ncbi:MAG: DUF3347 domain-containing protein [Cyclobacteriaceae bacterium]|nr:DUF3347 domain-containing protein [Cyclobacteriaceae bacterium]